MTRSGSVPLWLCTLLLATTGLTAQQMPLRVVTVGPEGPLDSLAQANEIRVVFSEPMVTLGRIPAEVQAPYVRITPAVRGAFRWSGTTILIFTPDPAAKLPYATSYQVTVDATATAVSGRQLAAPRTFTFTTPTVRLLSTDWYRRGGRFDQPLVMLLRFNQPVRAADIAAHLTTPLERHDWQPPSSSQEELDRLRAIDPGAVAAFTAKVAATQRVAEGGGAASFRLTTDWDRQRYPPAPDLVAFESTSPVLPESWIRVVLDEALPSPAGRATPGQPQSYTLQAEPAFFVNGVGCRSECDGDAYNPIELRIPVRTRDFAAALKVSDVTSGEKPVSRPPAPRRRDDESDASIMLTIEDAGYDAQPPDRRYQISLAPTLASEDGQQLGYRWLGIIGNWHMRAFSSFGDGHGVWERSGGALLPFYARNLRDVTQWALRLGPSDLMPRLLALQGHGFNVAPDGAGVARRLSVIPDRIQSHGLDLSSALIGGSGLVWAAVRDGATLPRARRFGRPDDEASRTRASIVQVTNLGVTVKDSPQNTLVFVTRLDTGQPVPGATVSIVRTDNTTFWKGTTGADGVAIAPDTRLRDPDRWYEFAFVVIAEKDGDIAYTGSDWSEGISPWEFGVGLNLRQRDPLLSGSVFTDRGVYRLGEEVHFKAILRENTPANGIRLLAEGTQVLISLRDAQNRQVDSRTIRVSSWSSAEWTMTMPENGTLGTYSLRAILERDRPVPKAPADRRPGVMPSPEQDDYVPYEKQVRGGFLVAAYRRPDFRVDVTLGGKDRIAGDSLTGTVNASYLFGAAMGERPVTWRYSRMPGASVPEAITERFGPDRWTFVGSHDLDRPEGGDIRRDETTLRRGGDLSLELETTRDAGIPYVYALDADVEDVSRQHIANRASTVVHPAPWYIGIRRPSFFTEQRTGLHTEIVSVGLDGTMATGVPVDLTLTRTQFTSVRRAEGNGFYTWDSERRDVPAGSWSITTGADPTALDISFDEGGSYTLEARGRSADGRSAVTRVQFYVLGDGYTAWARFDHNRITLVPERQTYRPGETARIMIQSPWEQATALVTTEREGIRSHRQFAVSSTQQSISVPITGSDIPNVFVSVLLVKGRTTPPPAAGDALKRDADVSDPGKPSFRVGYVELQVEDRSKRLDVTVSANQEEYRPAATANVRLDVRDHEQRGVASEVTLWAVDYGVLSLTNYRPPDVAGSVHVRKALQVMTEDSRQRLISRRVLTPKGETDGGGGGADGGPGGLRRDFRALAFWLGSVTTDASGRAAVDVKLPESLTTYRIMAVAADRESRFGDGDTEVRTNKPLTLRPTFPRFLAVGDTAYFGAVVGSQLRTAGTATVTMRSLDPGVLELTERGEQSVEVGAGGNVEVRFAAKARAIGRARVQIRVSLEGENDAFEDALPVEVLASPETIAAYGDTASGGGRETVTIPAGVVPGFGGLDFELSSTALVGLGEGARYLVEYPYGCAEQKASSSLALLLAADLGNAFSLPGMAPADMRTVAQRTLKEVEQLQCEAGGFAYWPGACWTQSPYLTAYVLHVLKIASDLKYDVDSGVRARAYDYLERELQQMPPGVDEGWWPSYTAWQAFAVRVLVEGGRNADSHLTRLYGYRDRMPVFAMAYLHDALVVRGEGSGPRVAELRTRMTNAILPEGGSGHVEELADPYLLWFWNSNVRSTAIVLNSLVKAGVDTAGVDTAQMRGLVRWMMSVRKNGRWGNTQENAYAMEALVNYYRKYESVVPDFGAVVTLGARELAREEFRGRSAEAATSSVPLAQVLAAWKPGTSLPLTFARQGTGTLFYSARLRYAADASHQDGLDAGLRVERHYEPFVENGSSPAATSFAAGDLVRVVLRFRLTKERRFVAVTDPLPAGFEPVDSWFATTSRDLTTQQSQYGDADTARDWRTVWQRGGFDRVERLDDRIRLFATRLGEGDHTFSYVVRATTAGTFRTAPTYAEEMYEPEVFGRTATSVIEVKR